MASDILGVMIEAAKVAGARLREDFADVSSLHIEHKNGPADPFTVVDVRAEETVRRILGEAFPRYGFLGEEGGVQYGEDKDHVWVVDPLDGTMNFLSGVPMFAVNIALTRRGEVVAGVTFAPMLDEMFTAETGGGAFLNDRPIRVSARQGLIQSVLAVGIPFAGKPHHDKFIAEMTRLTPKISGIRRLGAGAIDMAYVACGRFDAYWEQSVSPWDMAAGVALVREAGGSVTDTRGGPLDIHAGTVLACTPQLLPDLLAEIAP